MRKINRAQVTNTEANKLNQPKIMRRFFPLVLATVIGLSILTSGCLEESEKSSVQESYGQWLKEDNSIGWIPNWVVDQFGRRDKIKEQKIAKNIKEASFYSMRNQGFFNTKLLKAPVDKMPWSSGFFASWFGGVAGRWNRSKFKELFGYNLSSRTAVLSALKSATQGNRGQEAWLFKMSPMEKYDIAVADYGFSATKRELALRGHNETFMPLWNGYCNGVSIAATILAEPFRKVTIINNDGYQISLHPYDVKGLLSLAFYGMDYQHYAKLGERCKKEVKNPDPFFDITGGGEDNDGEFNYERDSDKSCRGVNPATLVLALQNRLGIAKRSFVVDKKQGNAVSNHPIGEAQINILQGPYSLSQAKYYKFEAPGTTQLVEVEIQLWLGSTALSDSKAVNKLVDSQRGLYRKIGFVPEREDNPHTYYATLELDQNGKMIGGEWGIKDKWGEFTMSNESPDFAWFGLKPLLINKNKFKDTLGLKGENLEAVLKHNRLNSCRANSVEKCDRIAANPFVKWSLIKAIYEKSIASSAVSPHTPVLDLRSIQLP